MQFGKGTLFDVCQAYRNVPVHTDDRHLLGMLWNNYRYGLTFRAPLSTKNFYGIIRCVGVDSVGAGSNVEHSLH